MKKCENFFFLNLGKKIFRVFLRKCTQNAGIQSMQENHISACPMCVLREHVRYGAAHTTDESADIRVHRHSQYCEPYIYERNLFTNILAQS